MNVAVFFADIEQVTHLRELNERVHVSLISEIPQNWLNKNGEYQFFSMHKAFDMYQKREITKFIIFPTLKKNLYFFYEDVLLPNVSKNDILYVSLEQMINGELLIDGLSTFGERKDLDYISVHIMDRCNLKCAHCSSMSGLIKNETRISYSKTIKSIHQISSIFKSVNYIQLLGGEPLLNEMLLDYCGILRNYFPYSYIEIATNGTQILSQKQYFFDALRGLNIAISVSYYPILADIIDRINTLLCKSGITYTISDRITHFDKYYDFSGSSDVSQTFWNCQSAQYCKNGLTLYEDYIYPCVAPIALYRAGVIDDPSKYGIYVSERITCQEIKSMIHPIEICRYCHMDQFQKWHQLNEKEINCLKSWSI